MNAPVMTSPDPPRQRQASGYTLRRAPLPRRHRQSRQLARQRASAHTKKPLTPEQRALELPHRRSPAARALAALAAIFGSVTAHVAVVAIGVITTALSLNSNKDDSDRVTIEVQEREEAKKEPEPPPPEPEPEPTAPTVLQKAPVAQQPTAEPEPEPVPQQKPLRVVGLSLESTSEGGDGPSFAVGNTRMGETADKAEDPREVKEEPKVVDAPKPKVIAPQAAGNRVASRIPLAKVEYTNPKKKGGSLEPSYPPTLKSQGIEGQVIVTVSIDAAGKVTDVKLVQPSPYPEFNEAARSTAFLQMWDPATRDGVPVARTLTYTYRFRLK